MNPLYLFTLTEENFIAEYEGLTEYQDQELRLFAHGSLTKDDLITLVGLYRENTLESWLEGYQGTRFLLSIYNETDHTFRVYNDKLSSNDIMYHKGDALRVTNDAHRLFESLGEAPRIDRDAIHESVAFFFVAAPKTVYRDVFAVTLGSVLLCEGKQQQFSVQKWWHPEKLLQKKKYNYDELVIETRSALLQALEEQGVAESSVALSSGVDSSGILGAVTHLRGTPPPVVTIAPHGLSYKDYIFAKEVADFYQADQDTLEPKVEDLQKLREYYRDMNQPMEVPFIFGFGVLLERAQELGAKKMGFGFGAEAVLGNLKIARIGDIVHRLEALFPFWMLRPLYRITAKIMRFSKNQLEFLLTPSWVERFFHTRGALLTREKKYFKNFNPDFVRHFRLQAEEVMRMNDVRLLDKFVLFYLHSWVIYAQTRDAISLGRKFNVDILAPFDHPRVFEILFRVPDRFRRKNNWSKQIIRDVFRPFTNEKIYNAEVGSLIVEYNEWVTANPQPFFKYLRTSPVVQDALELEKYEKEFVNLPEPGLSVVRWLGVAVWYDTNWNQDNLKNFDAIFEELKKD